MGFVFDTIQKGNTTVSLMSTDNSKKYKLTKAFEMGSPTLRGDHLTYIDILNFWELRKDRV